MKYIYRNLKIYIIKISFYLCRLHVEKPLAGVASKKAGAEPPGAPLEDPIDRELQVVGARPPHNRRGGPPGSGVVCQFRV